MASTPAGTRLTEAQRREQLEIRSGFLAEFLALWSLLDLFDLDRTTPGWVRAVLALIDLWRMISARSALDYFDRFRQLEVPGADPLPEIVFIDTPSAERAARRAARRAAPSVKRNPAAPRERSGLVRTPQQSGMYRRGDESKLIIDWGGRRGAVQASLEILGPINIKSKIKRGMTPEQAGRSALVEVSGAATRHVVEGGRQTNVVAMRNDKLIKGWVRVGDGNPCSFCAMLISRGPVYREESFTNARSLRNPRNPGVPFLGDGSFKTHDHCACIMVPVYYTDTQWPGQANELNELWKREISGKYSGKDAIRAWRRLYEQRQRDLQRAIEFPEAA